MGKRGPAPKPTNVRRLHGDRPDRINDAEPVPDQGGCPSPPSWLSSRAKTMWQRLAPDLYRKGVLTGWDTDAFAVTCASYVVWRDAQRILDAEGVLKDGPQGTTAHPAGKAARDAWQTFLQGASRFGLTPSDRSALKIDQEADRGKGADRLLS